MKQYDDDDDDDGGGDHVSDNHDDHYDKEQLKLLLWNTVAQST